MKTPFDRWKEKFLGLIDELKGIFEEELLSLLLPQPTVFEEIQERKKALLKAYEACIFEGKEHEALLKEVPEAQRKAWIQHTEKVQFLAERNAHITEKFIREIQQSFSKFHQWLKRPSFKSPYGLKTDVSLGLDRRM